METRFDQYISSIHELLAEEDNVDAANVQNLATNINPETVKSFKDTVLVPMLNKQNVDPNKMQEAIRAGVIEDHGDSIYTVTDAALSHVNQDPQLQGKFLPSQQAASEQKRAREQSKNPTASTEPPAAAAAPTQNQPTQNPTTTKPTSRPSTNKAGVVSSVYKLQ